jgi:hypothetical protein
VLKAFKKNAETTFFNGQLEPVSGDPTSGHETPDDDELVLTCKNESTSYYQFYKILNDESYTLGSRLTAFMTEFTT